MTTIDMSRVHRKLVEAAVANAKEFESIGALMEASKAWERAGRLAEAYANASTNPADRQARIHTSKSFLDRASQLRSQSRVVGNVKENATEMTSESFRDVIQGMVYRSETTMEEIAGLDLVITVLTSNVHFAGSMGVPTWCLTPIKAPWQFTQPTMPWYPKTRLYRQKNHGQWSDVITRIANDVKGLTKRQAAE